MLQNTNEFPISQRQSPSRQECPSLIQQAGILKDAGGNVTDGTVGPAKVLNDHLRTSTKRGEGDASAPMRDERRGSPLDILARLLAKPPQEIPSRSGKTTILGDDERLELARIVSCRRMAGSEPACAWRYLDDTREGYKTNSPSVSSKVPAVTKVDGGQPRVCIVSSAKSRMTYEVMS